MTELEKNAEELAYKWWHSVDKEFVDVIDAYVQGYKDANTNICDWLQHYLDCYVEVEGEYSFITDLKIHTDLIIEDLKKYLEEQQ